MQELAESLGSALDSELDAFVPLLLKRAGQVRREGGKWDCCSASQAY